MMKNILCVDDIEANLFTIASVLDVSVEEKYNIFTVLSVHDALEILLRQEIDLILLDVMMPDVNGFEAAKIIKSNKKTKEIPIIFVTAKKDDESISKCYESGGDDYINKPFNYIELLARVSFHLKLREKNQQIKDEREFTQNILDMQNNFIIVTDTTQVVSINKATLDFFNLKNINEFKNKYGYLIDIFVKEDGYFSIESDVDKFLWIDALVHKLNSQDVLVKILNNTQEYIFTIKINNFHKYYIITLTDVTQISQQSLEYKHEASFDALTQIYNRNMLHKLMDAKIAVAKTQLKPFVFIIFDIDFFKKINDAHGHLIGDNVLISISQLIKNHIRDKDIFARWGGEEFVLAFDVNLEKGVEIANNLKKYIEENQFDVVKTVTCSFGVTEFKSNDTMESMIHRADKALYEAKNSGRNLVCQA